MNLSALPTRFVDDLADPLRVVADPDRARRAGAALSSTPRRGGRRLRLLDRRLDGRPQVVRPQVEQDEARIELRQLEQVLGQPVEPLELLAARLEELGPRVGVVAGRLARAAR